MNRLYITIFHSLFSIGIALMVILSFDEVKILPSAAVILMAIGVNYSLFKYNRHLAKKKNEGEDIDEIQSRRNLGKE